MNLRRSRADEPEVNLTPLIDVVFILLIFFMVSTTFQRESQIKIELPEASAEPMEERKELLEIVIDSQGHYFIDEQQVVNSELETLKAAIR
ncbi:MAG: biopolymer transporter ExbD, partial [Gammaproteobacteria bacterium]